MPAPSILTPRNSRAGRLPVVPNPYTKRGVAWLLAANALRDEPLSHAKLSEYAGHHPRAIARDLKKLTVAGLFNPDGSLNLDSPLYPKLTPRPEPLPDLKDAVSLQRGAVPVLPDTTSLTPERAIALLTSWVETGAAGKDAPKFIAQIMELRRLVGKVAGPPEPRSDSELLARLVAILDSVPPSLLASALERVYDLQRARGALASPPETSFSPADPVQEPSGLSRPTEADNLPELPARSPA